MDTTDMITITGCYYKTESRNQEDGMANFSIVPTYAIPEAVDGLLMCEGKIKHYQKGMPIKLTGTMDNRVMKVQSDRLPVGTEDSTICLLEYVSKNLTEFQKEKIAVACGNDLMQFCADNHNLGELRRLLKRSANGDETAKQVFWGIRTISVQKELEETLLRYDVPFAAIEKMLRRRVTCEKLKNNPYTIFDQYDVPLSIADAFAEQECELDGYDPQRLKGFVFAAIKYLMSCGNSCCTLSEIENTMYRRFGKIRPDIRYGHVLTNHGVMEAPDICQYHTINGKSYVYLHHVWEEERNAIHHLFRIASGKKKYQCTVGVEETEKEIGIRYNAGQRAAFELLKKGGIKILTGPPGSGKTAVVNGLIQNFEANKNGTVKLAATTGLAAKVLHSATGRETQTAHAILRVQPFHDTVYGRDLNDPVDADLIIVDEVSMMGLQLFSVLAGAVRSGSILLLVGDENQLQSVEYGNVLHDLIDSGLAEVCRLTEILRQSGPICENASRVNNGNRQMILDSSFLIKKSTEESISSLLLADYDASDSQIICPVKKGAISTASINQMIQEKFNGESQVVATSGKRAFRLQDKIIMTKTNYEKGYINGDIGYIVDKTKNGELVVSFPDRLLYLEREDFGNMELAYAITIHKAQGSEFKRVHIVLPEAASHMMTRRLLYTAITRAKEKVIVYDQGNSFSKAITDRAEQPRLSLLGQRIQLRLEGKQER